MKGTYFMYLSLSLYIIILVAFTVLFLIKKAIVKYSSIVNSNLFMSKNEQYQTQQYPLAC